MNDSIIQQVISIIDKDTSLIKMSLRSLVQKIEDWNENRVLSETKVKEIIDGYEKRDIALLTSHFRSVSYPDGRQVLIDGHHRKEAAKVFLTTCSDFNEDIYVYIWNHQLTNDSSADNIYDLHIKSNLCQPLKSNQIPNRKRTEIIEAFKKHPILKNGISPYKSTKTAHQPKISLNELAELAGELNNKYPNLDTSLIIDNIKLINNYLSLIFTNDNIQSITLSGHKIKEEVINKAQNINFYLNIRDSKYNKDEWIKYVEFPWKINISDLL